MSNSNLTENLTWCSRVLHAQDAVYHKEIGAFISVIFDKTTPDSSFVKACAILYVAEPKSDLTDISEFKNSLLNLPKEVLVNIITNTASDQPYLFSLIRQSIQNPSSSHIMHENSVRTTIQSQLPNIPKTQIINESFLVSIYNRSEADHCNHRILDIIDVPEEIKMITSFYEHYQDYRAIDLEVRHMFHWFVADLYSPCSYTSHPTIWVKLEVLSCK